MKIPKEFKLQEHLIKVFYKEDLHDDDHNELFGESDSNRNKITLARTHRDGKKKRRILRSQVEHTFIHELVHQLLDRMGELKLSRNEKFVDTLAGLLHQYMNTKKY